MFVILAHQRTGTHLLASLLNSHPDLRCYDEACLDRENLPLGKKEIRKLKKNEGCILMYTQFIKEYRKDNNFSEFIGKAKIIHLQRVKINDHFKSLFKKRNSKVNPQKARWLKWYIGKLKQEVFRHDFKHVYDITYGEICNHKNITEYENEKLLKFLGVKPAKLRTNFRKGKW